MRNILLCLLAAASLIVSVPARASSAINVLEIPASPNPAQVKAAKQAFGSGDIVAMRGGNIAAFDGLLNISVAAADSRHRQPPACVEAARRLHSGQVRTFYAGSQPFAQNGDAACETSFSNWIAKQSLVENTDIPYWTDVDDFETNVAYTPKGNKITASGSVYRANSIDPQTDYYLVVFTSTCVAAPGFTPFELQPAIHATIGNGVVVTASSAGPLFNSPSINALGENVPFPNGASGAYSQSNVPRPFESGLGEEIGDSGENDYLWVYYWDNTGHIYGGSGNSAISAAVFGVPAGTSSLTVNLSEEGKFDGNSPGPQDNATGSVSLHVDAPFLSVPAQGFAMIGTKGSIDVQASPYLGWQITGEPLFVPTNSIATGHGTATTSTGNDTVSFNVPSSGDSQGQEGTFSFDTQQPSASPATRTSVLSASIDLVANSPQAGVLVAGGVDWKGHVLNTADVWNTATHQFQQTAYPMKFARQSHTATLLETLPSLNSPQQGKILIAGGFGQDGKALTSTELFDPATGIF